MQENLYEDFEKVSDEQWKQKIITDLKGKSISDLNWTLKDDLIIHPYYTQTDTKNIDFPILRTNNPDWQIGEIFEVKDYNQTNKIVLEALLNGVTAPVFYFFSLPNQKDFNLLFENIKIEFIATHFYFESDGIDYLSFYSLWENLLNERKVKALVYFDFDALLLKDEIQKINMINVVEKNQNQKTIHINCKAFHTNTANSEIEIAKCIEKTKQYFDFFIANGIKAENIAKQTYFTINIGLSYLLETAKIRALKLRWIELLDSYQIEAFLPFIKIEFSDNAYGENIKDNLINETSLCMSAVMGGANHIVVKPTENTEKGIRLARNVQLILKHESGFNQVSDPMAGSYYIEVLTDLFLKNSY